MNLGSFMGIFKFYFSFLKEWCDDEDELVVMKICDARERSVYGGKKMIFLK